MTDSKLNETFTGKTKKVTVPAPGGSDFDTSSMRNWTADGQYVGPTVEIEVPDNTPEQKPYDIDTSSMRGFAPFQK